MNCEKCEQVLPGAAVICRNCGFNNALQGISGWHRKRNQVLNTPRPVNGKRTAARKAADATLIRFPTSAEKAAAVEPDAGDLPPWRRQVHEKVRQLREQRKDEATAARTESRDSADLNPIVEAAVRRLRRGVTPAVRPSSLGQSAAAQATARALEYDEEPARHEAPPAPVMAQKTPVPEPPASRPFSSATGTSVMDLAGPAAAPALSPAEKTEATPDGGLGEAVVAAGVAIEVESPSDTPGSTVEIAEPLADCDQSAGEEVISEAAGTTAAAAGDWMMLPHYSSGRAPVLARVAAFIIDLEVIAFSFLPFFTAFTLFNADFNRSSFYALSALALVMTFIYYLLTVAIAGRTCGMAVFRIRVADAMNESEQPSLSQSIRRAAGAVLSLVFIPLNVLVIALSAEQQSLSDQFSGTAVVRQ